MINSLLQSIKDKFGSGKGGSKKSGGKGGTIKRKSANSEIDDQWAAAIEAINAASQGKPKEPAALGDLPTPLFDEDEKPTVVTANPPPLTPPKPSKPRFSPRVEPIVPLLLQEAGLRNLTGDDFMAIEAYLAQRSAMGKDDRKQASLNLARQMKNTMAMAKLPQKMSADLFLEALHAIHQNQS